ncbi:hypothetical protein Aasi_1864 [Candidatus Amoebophilus asiaticus 5a2]|uniref:Uncharacterized protein n=1 Tax=Amoebophilus asiaticus (strain 5a2) TaxID=452471 RepID=C3L461_AMOA5|nr:hypothetical protein [Candidatus Amoebophilus asiaticus]ACP21102.1 hypothetical protein Aasi_1864 [Candidatus Amoebophilus asiaticus 5a2]
MISIPLDRKLLEAILAQKKATYHTKLLELESEQKSLSLQQLVQAIEEPKQASGELFPFLSEVCQNLTQSGKIGRARLYKRLLTSLKEFTGSKQFCFSDKDDFVFPILNKNEHTTPQQISNRINRVLRGVNDALKELAQAAILDDLCSASYLCNGLKAKCHLNGGD